MGTQMRVRAVLMRTQIDTALFLAPGITDHEKIDIAIDVGYVKAVTSPPAAGQGSQHSTPVPLVPPW